MKRRKFIATCTGCILASMSAVLLNKNSLAELTENNDMFGLNHIQVHIVEHCNLSCKYCVRFSSIAQEGFYELDKFKQDIAKLSKILNKKLLAINLMGGEPLLNPQINEYVKISRKYFPKSKIKITPNLILLDDMDKNFWKTLNKYNAVITPSVYPIKINWKSILNKADKFNVLICNERFEKITRETINKNRIFTSFKLNLKPNGDGGKDKKYCYLRFKCNNLYDGKLYPCYTIPYVRHLNEKFNTNFKVTENDYIDVRKISSKDEIEEFMKNKTLPFCKYCADMTNDLKWENSPVHDLSEWT